MVAGTEDVSDNSDDNDEYNNWQTVSNKRSATKSPIGNDSKRKHISDDVASTSNRYSSLAEVDEENTNVNDNNDNTNAIKPPPIFIPDINNIVNMVDNISTVIPRSDFTYKSVKGSEIKLVVKTIDSYRKLIKHFEKNKICYHTYQVRQERSYRVVFKGLHHTYPVEDIKADLLLRGYGVRNVVNVRSSKTKEPLPLFFVDLDPNPNNKTIYEIKHINNAIVFVEPPKKTNDLVQCYRCQQFGHTQGYCKRPFRCVKCALDHPTSACRMKDNSSPRCIHCLMNHTANYKGCTVYQELIKKRQLSGNKTTTQPRYPTFNVNNIPQNNQQNNNNATSYANVTKGQEVISDNNILLRIDTMLNKQIELTNTLLNMMSLLLTKLCN